MKVNYTEVYPFRPIPSITPASDYWQNSTWKFNMSEVTAGTTSQPSWIDIILHGNTALTLVNAKANGLNYLKLFGGTEQVSGTYLDSVTLSGGTEQNGTPTPTTPMDIVCNNGALKANTNIYWTEYKDYQLSRTDGITVISAPDVNVSGMVDCRTVKSFKITTISQQGSFRIFKYGADNTFINATSTADIGGVITFGDNVGFFRIQYNYIATGTENILIYNSAYDLNEVYTDGTVEQVTDSVGNTANAEMLLAVGNYKDTQEVLTGTVSRNVGIKVLDGTESWTRYAQITGGYLFYTENTITDNKLGVAYTDLYCTHAVPGQIERWTLNICRFAINSETGDVAGHRLYFSTSEATTVDGFKTWLATQCANGTPVIIAYPLSTASTESATPQVLAKSPVTQTAGSISNLPIATTESVHTTPTPQRPLPINCNNGVVKVNSQGQIYTDGTQETVTVTGKNLFDSSVFNTNVGQTITWLHFQVPNGTYTMSTNFPPYRDIYTNVWILAGNVTSGNNSEINGVSLGNSKTVTVTDGWYSIAYRSTDLNITRNPKDYNWQLEQGSTATAYEPYFNGGSATAENLFKVGTYQDVQEVLAGGVTRNVGVMVLDGTENWQVYAPGHYYLLGIFSGLSSIAGSLCTHFTVTNLNSHRYDMNIDYGGTQPANLFVRYEAMTTLSDFKQFLADQYNAGTPVIIVYPLATATTETVTAQPLTTQEGTNIVEITQASIDNLELEVSYKAGVEVTITEVENAQLDNNVEVTIQ